MSRKLMFLVLCLLFAVGIYPLQAYKDDDQLSKSVVRSQSLNVDHLSGHGAHEGFLLNALMNARRSVMISTYGIEADYLLHPDIEEAFNQAMDRGVNVYIYHGRQIQADSEWQASGLQEFMDGCQRSSMIPNHSKCLIVDNTLAAVGSYNWLSPKDDDTINKSFVFSGSAVQQISDDIWQGIRFYNSIANRNRAGMITFLRDNDAFTTGAYEFKPHHFIYTMRTPDAHRQLWEDEVVAKAKRHVVISSPFIRLSKLQEILSDKNMRKLQERGAQVHLVTSPSPTTKAPKGEQAQVFRYLQGLQKRFSNFSFSTQEGLHAKTIIADDLLCEGSYNLLSAHDDIDDESNNLEISFALRGPEVQQSLPTVSGSLRQYIKIAPSSPQKRSSPSSSPESEKRMRIDQPYQVFSGERFNRAGFCVRIGGDYIRDGRGKTQYFPTVDLAHEMAESSLFM